MLRTLPPPLIATPLTSSTGIVEPLPSTSCLGPTELAQAYQTWRFGPARSPSPHHLIGRAER